MTRRTVMLINLKTLQARAVDQDWWEKQIDTLTADGWIQHGEPWDTTPETDYFAERNRENITSILAGKEPVACIDDYRDNDDGGDAA